ncbi:MAG: hypothetical protein ABIR33_15775 [Pyrinomonadaceae bacterium]
MKELLMMLLQIIGAVCALGFVGWFLNRFFGFSMGSKAGVVIPTEWEAGVSFIVAAAVCFAIVHFFGKTKGDVTDKNSE